MNSYRKQTYDTPEMCKGNLLYNGNTAISFNYNLFTKTDLYLLKNEGFQYKFITLIINLNIFMKCGTIILL